MPLVRLKVRNVYGLGQVELHTNVDLEEPKSMLDGVAVSGLVGILRQIGDLTEFAAEIFHGIQEEVMITASRSNQLKMRLKQIEATIPSIQKTVLAQTNHIHFSYTGGVEWHTRLPNVQNHFIYDDLPQFIMAPYEDCRDPPRLHMLDKFDINGPGSCLKRYSDPSHFKTAPRVSNLPETKKKKFVPHNRDVSNLASVANQSDRRTFTSLSFSGRTSSSKTASTIETESKSDLQDHRSCSFDSRSGGEKLKGVFTSSRFTQGSMTIASVLSETESESEDANYNPSQDLTANGSSCVSWHEKAAIVESDEAPEVMKTNFDVDAEQRGAEMDSESEEDDFVDAPYTIDSESDNDQTLQITQEVQKKSSNDEITEEKLEKSVSEQEAEKISNNVSDSETICAAASDVTLASSLVNKSDEMIDQGPWAASYISNGTHNYSNGFSNPLYDVNGIQEHQESEDEASCDTESAKIWTNGNLLGLKPLKPEIVVATIPENDEEKGPFDWFTSSPPLNHMKISFNPSEDLPSSELKLELPEENTISSFQLVPETSVTSLPDSDSDKDTFCRSSENSENHSVSIISEQQCEEEEEESGESKSQQEIFDSFHRINFEDSSLTAPSNGYLGGNLSYLQNPAEPLPPPLPPLQWMVSKIPLGRLEDNQIKMNNRESIRDTLICKSLTNVEKEEPSIVNVSHHTKLEHKVHQKNNVRDFKQSYGNAKQTETGDFLHQIRTKQFNLRRVVTTKTSSDATMNNNISVILEKANSIRQAVASDDGDEETDAWSDSDT